MPGRPPVDGTLLPTPAETSARDRAISRPVFEQVIRRAAELSLTETDAEDNLSEAEVIRIATELGLPVHHVQRALFELPELTAAPRWYDRYFGSPVFSVSRVVPGDPAATLRRIEDYLVTREYLQIVRRRGETLALVPAEDTISSVARALFRPGSRHSVARASRVLVGTRRLHDAGSHVRFEADLSGSRRDLLRTGIAAGGAGGLLTGGVAAGITAGVLGGDVSLVPHILAFGGAMAATVAAGFSVAASHFRSRVLSAESELAGLLDRLEQGERLDPPPPPWRRRLQLRLFGDRS
ncbi:MAG: hypothetical protein WD054_03295 [Gemmatimonadota bacterium]